jgi:hypothetical protein
MSALKNAIFWDVTSCGSLRTVVSEERTASVITTTLMMEAICYSEREFLQEP